MKTKIFLDSADPIETREALSILGFLDGQTTNPSLIANNPQAQARLASGHKFSRQEVLDFYRQVVKEISSLIPQGSVSIEVYADRFTTAEQMLAQGTEFFAWVPNSHIKFPITKAGLTAVELGKHQGLRANLTLCFSQQQAAAVFAATGGMRKGDCFISPFIGRLDDVGQNGMSVVANIIKLYKDTDLHVEVLAASIRSVEHLLAAISLGADIATAPLKILKQWAGQGFSMPDVNFRYQPKLEPVPYQAMDLGKPWEEFDLHHDLTDKGLERFANDWNRLVIK